MALSKALLAGVGSTLVFIVLNVAMNIYTKWLFDKDGGDFALPWTMLAAQQAQAYLVLQVLGLTSLFCLNVGSNSSSLVDISITLNQTIRAFLPVGVLVFATCIEKRAYPSHSYWTSVVLVFGIGLTCWGSPNFKLYGSGLALVSTLVAAVATSWNGRLLSKGPFSKSGPFGIARLMMLQSLPAFFIFALMAAWLESQKLWGVLFEPAKFTWFQRFMLVSASSALALLSNLGRCFLVAATSALMETIAGNAKVAALCAIDHQLFHTELFFLNYCGIVVTFMGFSIHILLQYASPPTRKDEEDKGQSAFEDGPQDTVGVGRQKPLHGQNGRSGNFMRPRLISAADTGLAAEHVACQMGRSQKNRSESGDSTATGSSIPEHLRPRSVTWPAPRPQPEATGWMNVDMSLVLEVPLWLDPERAGRIPATIPEEYSPVSHGSMSPARSYGGGSPAARLASAGSPSARLRAHTDPAFQSKTRLLDDHYPRSSAATASGGLLTVPEEVPEAADSANGARSSTGGPLPPPELQWL